MKKLLLFGVALGFALTGKAQVITENAVIIDQAEDTTQVNTINDIVVMQEMVNTRTATDAHIANVWSRKSFFNIGYSDSKLKSKNPIALNSDKSNDQVLSFKSDWGAMLQLGHSYTLHRGAIANMVQINLDYTYIDLTGHGYEKDDLIGKFKPDEKWSPEVQPGQTQKSYNYDAWGAKKYDATYGMSLGPSVTVAPFTPLRAKGLHFIKLNGFVHFGYNVGGIFYNYKYKKTNDNVNPPTQTDETISNIYWGHGMSISYGVNLSWKAIGLGWETRTTNLDYKSVYPSRFSGDKLKFKDTTSRFYISIKY